MTNGHKSDSPFCKTRQKNLVMIAIYILFAALVLAAVLCPYYFDNAFTIAADATRLDCSRTVSTYDDNHNIIAENVIRGEFVGSEISAISENSSILWVNHIPNQFVSTNIYDEFTPGLIERVDNLTKAEFGTLEFVFFNLDPMHKDFKEQASTLSRFWLNSEKMVYFDFYLPFCFDAATIYNDIGGYVSAAGDMGSMYNPQKFSDPYIPFVPNVVDKVPQTFRLSFVMDPIVPDRLEAARIVTVHYRAKDGVTFDKNLPFAGTHTAVKQMAETKIFTHIIFIAVAISLAMTFLVLMLLKRNFALIGQLGILVAAILLLFAGLVPLIGNAASVYKLSIPAAALLFLSAVSLATPHKKGFIRYKTLCVSLCIANLLVSILLPLTVSPTLFVTYTQVISSVLSAVLLTFVFLQWRKDLNGFSPPSVIVATVSGMLSVFLTFPSVCFFNSTTSVAVLAIPIMLFIIFMDIFRTERRNANLTHNLATEVTAQTAILGSALSDREKILSFLSHDMKKSALGIKALTEELGRNAPDDAIRNYADKIESKNNILLNSFSDILEFTKQNFTSEPFTSFTLGALLSDLVARVRPDCEANGIDFTFTAKKFNIRAKRASLLSVLFNLVFNAIEHSVCTQITLTAKKSNGLITIKVADNGKGILDTSSIFNPYVSDNDDGAQNTGLGLFIVKSEIEAMGGTISYESKNGSIFTLTILSDD